MLVILPALHQIATARTAALLSQLLQGWTPLSVASGEGHVEVRSFVKSRPMLLFLQRNPGKDILMRQHTGKPYVFLTWCHRSYNPQFLLHIQCYSILLSHSWLHLRKTRSVRLSWSTTQTCQKPSLLSLAVLPGRCHGKSFVRDLWLFRIWEILPDSIWQHLSLMSWSLKHPQHKSDLRCFHEFSND